jgi:hypothetical protein
VSPTFGSAAGAAPASASSGAATARAWRTQVGGKGFRPSARATLALARSPAIRIERARYLALQARARAEKRAGAFSPPKLPLKRARSCARLMRARERAGYPLASGHSGHAGHSVGETFLVRKARLRQSTVPYFQFFHTITFHWSPNRTSGGTDITPRITVIYPSRIYPDRGKSAAFRGVALGQIPEPCHVSAGMDKWYPISS